MPSTLPVIHCGDIAVKRGNKISNPKYPKYPQWWSVALTITHYTLPRRPCKERKIFICCLKSGGHSNNCSLLSQVVKLVLVVYLYANIVKTSDVYLKTKKNILCVYGVGNFFVLMCWSNLDRGWWWNPLCTTIWAFYCTWGRMYTSTSGRPSKRKCHGWHSLNLLNLPLAGTFDGSTNQLADQE